MSVGRLLRRPPRHVLGPPQRPPGQEAVAGPVSSNQAPPTARSSAYLSGKVVVGVATGRRMLLPYEVTLPVPDVTRLDGLPIRVELATTIAAPVPPCTAKAEFWSSRLLSTNAPFTTPLAPSTFNPPAL